MPRIVPSRAVRLPVAALVFALAGCGLWAAEEPQPTTEDGRPLWTDRKDPIYCVSELSVERDGEEIVVSARGLTRTGGWSHPTLRRADGPAESGLAGVAAFSFEATPPAPDMMVVQALVPIEVSTRVDAAGIDAVEARAETNFLTAPIGETALAPGC